MSKLEIIFATGNNGKVSDLKSISSNYDVNIVTASSLNIDTEVEETGLTYADNAAIKVKNSLNQITDHSKVVIAEDSGLEITALDGIPGIKTKRWLGKKNTYRNIRERILQELHNTKERSAKFKCAMALGTRNSAIQIYQSDIDILILNPQKEYDDKFPLGSILYIPEYRLTLSQIYRKKPSDRVEFPTHREKAFKLALKSIVN